MPYMTADDGADLLRRPGPGSPIFLIHGWTMNHKFFRHNIRAIPHPPRRDVDIRGHGHSGKRELNMSRPGRQDAGRSSSTSAWIT